MLRQGNVTMRAFHHMTAGSTGNKTGISPSVQKKNTLLPLIKPVCQKLLQFSAEYGTVSFLQLFSQVYGMYFGKCSSCQPFF
jgi:hypothetical protein